MLPAKLPFESAVLQFNGTIFPCLLTCPSHIFTNPEPKIFLIFLQIHKYLIEVFDKDQNRKKKSYTTVYFSRKRVPLKTARKISWKKFVDSGFVTTCDDEHIISGQLNIIAYYCFLWFFLKRRSSKRSWKKAFLK